jgi:hypothetical protein
MSAGIQLTLQNSTPQTRRFFILWQAHDHDDADAVALDAWQSFTLAPGGVDYTAVAGSFQIAARSRVADTQPQTILAESDFGTRWSFRLDGDNAPELVPVGEGMRGSIDIDNRSGGPALFRIRRNVAPIWETLEAASGTVVRFQPAGVLHFYVSVALVDDEQPIVLEPMTGKLVLDGRSPVTMQFRQDGGTREWLIV